MSKINQHFLIDLFEKKKVSYHPAIYRKLYYSIWPCETFFKEFLTVTDPSLRLDLAKKIYTYIQTTDDVFLPTYMVSDVISFQLHHLKDSQLGYVPQDHVIHSVSLYILGIYLFFNLSSFHQPILENSISDGSLYERADLFVRKWRTFAFYHDIGYFYEGNTDINRKLKRGASDILDEYNKFTEQILYHYTTRSVARLLLIEALIHKSTERFNFSQISTLHRGSWVTHDHFYVDTAALMQELEPFNNAKVLAVISNYDAFDGLISLYINRSYLSILYDEDARLKGILIYENNYLKECFFPDAAAAASLSVNLHDKADVAYCYLPAEWTCKYVVPDIEQIIKSYSPHEYAALVNEFHDDLPKSLRLNYLMAATDQKINECFYDTMLWLWNKSKSFLSDYRKTNFLDMYTECMSKYIKDSFLGAIYTWVDKSLSEKVLKQDLLEKELNKLTENLKTPLTSAQIIGDAMSSAAQSYNADNGISLDITRYYDDLCRLTYEHFYSSDIAENIRDLNFIVQKNHNSIAVDLFAHKEVPNKGLYEASLYDRLSELANQLGIKLDDLKNYRPPHSLCDHGVISAGLLYQATVICCYLADYSKQKMSLRLAWRNYISTEKMTDNIFINQYAEVIFSILIHNIYTQTSSPKHGINYEQSINANPFSFFCAFCDLLQKWNRPKQLDLARTELPSEHYLGDNFDIDIQDDKIVLHCSSDEANAIRREFQTAEQYLPGASILISL